MARKQRDHRAEYQARKRKATQLGYKSEREYKTARKQTAVGRRGVVPPKTQLAPGLLVSMARLRRESKAWSKKHSRVANSEYKDSLTDDQVRRYHRAFVEDIPGLGKSKSKQNEKRKRIHDYLVPDLLDDKEWTGKYVPQA